MLSPLQIKRYRRTTDIDVIGDEGQARLLASRVLVAGAGGLGSPAALYLAAAGVGTLGIVDSDVVDISNLQRQILYGTRDIGSPKVLSAASRLEDLNPDTKVVAYPKRLDSANASRLVAQYDVVVDALDNFESRYVLNRACIAEDKPLVEAGVVRSDGVLFTVFPRKGPCYNCVFGPRKARDTGDEGIVGPVAGAMGSLQALEVIKIITGAGEPLVGRLLLFDGFKMVFREIQIERKPDCSVCGDCAD